MTLTWINLPNMEFLESIMKSSHFSSIHVYSELTNKPSLSNLKFSHVLKYIMIQLWNGPWFLYNCLQWLSFVFLSLQHHLNKLCISYLDWINETSLAVSTLVATFPSSSGVWHHQTEERDVPVMFDFLHYSEFPFLWHSENFNDL